MSANLSTRHHEQSLEVSRRGLLQLTGIGVGAAWLLGHAPAIARADDPPGDDFEIVARRWTALSTGNEDIDPADPDFGASITRLEEEATGYLDTHVGGADGLWADAPYSGPSANITTTANRLRVIALAVITPGTSQFGSQGAIDLVLSGMELFCTTGFAPSQPVVGNTWDWGIGTPKHLTDGAVYLREHLTDSVRSTLVASLNARQEDVSRATGANLTDVCLIEMRTSILERNAARIASALSYVPPSFEYRTDGDGTYASRDGMHADGSFIQHDRIAYTGTYGHIFLRGVATLAALTTGTQWEITDPRLENVFETAIRGYIPMVYDGLMMDSVRGRAVARSHSQDANDGLSTVIALLTLARADADAGRAARMRSAAKGMLTRSTARPYTGASLATLAIAKSAMNDGSIVAAEEPKAHNQFPDMCRFVHRRPGWASSISLSSSRTGYYEALDRENPRGWHTGAGMGMVYLRTDNAQFNDNFWNTVDPYRLPGITVQNKPLPNSYGPAWTPPGVTWVGGSVLDGRYGAVGSDQRTLGSALRARKSWFCFDDAVVALGAGITVGAFAGADVETIVENRKLVDPRAEFVVDGDSEVSEVGEEATFRAGWLHLADVGGYLVLDEGAVRCARVEQSGTYAEIGGNRPPDTEVATRTYLQIVREHGAAPVQETYAYAVAPAASAKETKRLWKKQQFAVVANTADLQAVTDTRTDVTMLNFFAAGSIDGVTVSGPCSLVLRRERKGKKHPRRLDVAISNPTRAETAVEVSIEGGRYKRATGDPAVTVLSTGDPVRLPADFAGVRGTSLRVTLLR